MFQDYLIGNSQVIWTTQYILGDGDHLDYGDAMDSLTHKSGMCLREANRPDLQSSHDNEIAHCVLNQSRAIKLLRFARLNGWVMSIGRPKDYKRAIRSPYVKAIITHFAGGKVYFLDNIHLYLTCIYEGFRSIKHTSGKQLLWQCWKGHRKHLAFELFALIMRLKHGKSWASQVLLIYYSPYKPMVDLINSTDI